MFDLHRKNHQFSGHKAASDRVHARGTTGQTDLTSDHTSGDQTDHTARTLVRLRPCKSAETPATPKVKVRSGGGQASDVIDLDTMVSDRDWVSVLLLFVSLLLDVAFLS